MAKSSVKISVNFVFLLFILVNFWACNGINTISSENSSSFTDYTFEAPEATGNTFYIDPENGSANGDGSAENPWRTLQEVVEGNLIECYSCSESYNPNSELKIINEGAPVKGGDKLVLRNGYHGYIKLNNFIFTDWLTIEAESGHTPVLSHFRIVGAFEKIYLRGLTVRKDSYIGESNYWDTETLNRNSSACFYLASSDFWGRGSNVKLNGLTVKTTENTSSWSAADWVKKSASGISLRSVEHVEIVNCVVENIRHGITIEYHSDHSVAINNTINNYSADGCRLISNDVLFAYNTITNCYDVDENHDDAIQSYSRGADNSPGTGVLKNVVIRGNLIIGVTDAANPLAGNPQGIGCFDGLFENWIVENNVVITDHYHGISFYGMRNSKIVNNTVIDQIPSNDTSPWIRINPHKNGTESSNCLVANNIAYRSIAISGNNVEERNNYVLGRDNYNLVFQLFTDPNNFDFHLLANDTTRSNIIDKGEVITGLVSSEMDKDGVERTMPPDLGAYELR